MRRKKEWEYMIYAWNKRLSENDLQIATRKRDVSQFLHIFINYVLRRHSSKLLQFYSMIKYTCSYLGEGIKKLKKIDEIIKYQ